MAEEKKDRRKEPWVVQQARQAVKTAEEKVESANTTATKKTAQDDLKKAKDRLESLLKSARRSRRATTSVSEAEKAVEAAKKTPGRADDRAAEKALSDAQRRAERTGEKKKESRESARDFFYSEMGPFIAEAVREFPQLRDFFRQAVAGGWDAAKQLRELNNPENAWFDWWQKRGSYWQAGFQRQYKAGVTKGQWDEDLKKSREIIVAAAKEAGVTLTEEQITSMSRRYWYSEWQADPDALSAFMQRRSRQQREGAPVDGETDPLLPVNRNTKIRELAALAEAYGLEYDEQTLGLWADKILNPKVNTNGIEDSRFIEQLVLDAKGRYAPFADQISADTSLRQLAGGYISEMIRLLELSPGDVRLTPGGMNPLLQRALTDVDPESGKPRRVPLWEFSKQIRQSDDWQMTDNARDRYMSAASKFSKALGLAG
jgi:hypothetical protein